MTNPSTAVPPVRWALAGFGSGGRIFHAPLIASAPAMSLAAVVTTSTERRASVARSYPDALCVSDLAQLPQAGVQGVTVSTPPATHHALALQAIALGLHVVIDKPVGLDAAQVSEIRAAADYAGVVAAPYFNRRWDNDFVTLQRVMESGQLGSVHRFESRLDRFRPIKPGWPSDREAGGGLLLDLGPHLVDQATRLLGPACSVWCHLSTVRAHAGAEDDFHLFVQHSSGAHSILAASLAAAEPGPRFLAYGDEAGIRIEGFDIQEAQLKAGGSPSSLGEKWGVGLDAVAQLRTADGVATTIPLDPGRWDSFYPAIAARITGGGIAPTDLTSAWQVARVLDAARQSDQTGARVMVE